MKAIVDPALLTLQAATLALIAHYERITAQTVKVAA